MKKAFLTLLIVGATSSANAQNVLPQTGNVGIGTTNLVSTFTVNGSTELWSQAQSGTARPAISAGTIIGEIRAISPGRSVNDDGFLRLSSGGGTNGGTKSFIDLSAYSTLPDMNQNIVFGTNGTEKMRILSNGNIGIGTSAPNVKLAVNGDLKAKKVKVTATEWPDYVFGENYQLMDIMAVADFINKNSHLPGVPSATEILKSEEVDLGEMNNILLKKIEELTLYIIELKKENVAIKELLKQNNIK